MLTGCTTIITTDPTPASEAQRPPNAFTTSRGITPKKVRQVKKSYRQFSDSSIYKVLVALDEVADRSEIRSGWLKNAVEPILNRNDILTFGIATPAKYGEMPRSILVPLQ